MRSCSGKRLVWTLAIGLLALPLAGPVAGCSGAKKPPNVQLVGNSVCPVSGKPVGGSAKAPTFHSDFKGYRVGFMCPSCKGDFDGSNGKKKLRLLNKALQSVGKPVVK